MNSIIMPQGELSVQAARNQSLVILMNICLFVNHDIKGDLTPKLLAHKHLKA